MPDWLPSIPYPSPQDGFWSPVTSTLNWCEEDYYATIYSAEIINTLTNLLFIYLAFKGINNCLRNDHDSIFLVTFLGYFVVGTGSFLFHSTLKYPMQLVDELSMIYTTCLMFYATFSYGQSRLYAQLLGVFLLALSAFITGYYHYLQDPAFHQNMYALLTAVVLLRSMYIMEVRLRPTLKAKRRAASQDAAALRDNEKAKKIDSATVSREQLRKDERDLDILRTMWTMVGFGLSIFLGGFAIWTLDNEFCGTLRRWRREVGLPWGIVLEGHGWWHLMTGIGAYFYIVWGVWLRHCLNGKQDEYELVWPNYFHMPLIVKTETPYQLNGDAKHGKKNK